MIKLAGALIVKAIVELGLVLLVFVGLIFVVAYRTARLFVTPEPDKLDRLAGGIAATLNLAARRSRFAELDDEPELEEWPADPGVEQADAGEDFDWREQAV